MSSATPEDERAHIERVCAEMKLGPYAANTVAEWLQRDPSTWPTCCLSDCDPCNGRLRKAARRVLAEREG